MKWKIFSSYIFSIIFWVIGVVLGTFWGGIYNESTESHIDVIGVLSETLTPAILSVVLANYIIDKLLKNYEKKNTHKLIINGLLICIFVYVLAQTLLVTKMYENIIYVVSGIISCIIFINTTIKKIKEEYSSSQKT